MHKRIAAAAASLGLVALLVFVPAGSASAAIGDPITPLPYTPSQVTSALSGFSNASDVTKAYAAAYQLAFQAARDSGKTVEAASAAARMAVPAPATAASALTRAGTVGAGSTLTAGMFGWAIGQGGLSLYAAATGSDYGSLICSQPGWYQAVNSFIMLSMGPDCKALVGDPNFDKPASWTIAGRAVTVYRVTYGGEAGKRTVGCVPGPELPAGQTMHITINGQSWGSWIPTTWGGNAIYGVPPGCIGFPHYETGEQTGWVSVTNVQIKSGSTVVSQGVESKPNPLRNLGCTVSYAGGSVRRVASGTYTEGDGLPTDLMQTACRSAWDAKPSGAIPSKISVDAGEEAGGARTTISEQNLDPDAIPAETGPNKPGLILYKTVGTVVQSCNTWDADCAKWWEETDEGTSTTSPYKCFFAGVEVPLVECGPYRTSFDTKTGTPTITDPLTGNPTPWTATPSTGNSLNPGVGPGTGVDPAGECFASGWASVMNPVDWVLVPVKCALVWAFVPRTSVIEGAVNSIGEAAGNVAAVDPLMGLLAELPSGAGCSGIPIELTFFGHTARGHLLAACDGYGATAAVVVNGLLTLAVVTMGVLSIARYFGAVFGFVGPGGSFESTQRATESIIQRQSGTGGA